MHRLVLESWLPWLLVIVAGIACLFVLAGISGARLEWNRLRRLHACQAGSVQSLSFVLTLPLFIMIVMFIVQVSQLMVGIAVVHYAAFASARAAIVWIPSNVSASLEGANQLAVAPQYSGNTYQVPVIGAATPMQQWKYRQIWKAAVLACASVSPTTDTSGKSQVALNRQLYNETVTNSLGQTMSSMYTSLAPTSQPPPQRLRNKLAYSAQNTTIAINGLDKDGFNGPASYNPRNSPNPDDVWDPLELGWEDPLTITVSHNFALLPGPGRWLIAMLANNNGTPDRVSGTIKVQTGETNQRFYSTLLTASVTLSNEGFKSVIPYVIDQNTASVSQQL